MNEFSTPKVSDVVPPGESVGKSIPHDSAVGHVTGTAPYIDDLPRRVDELFVGFVGSPVASGTINSIDLEKAIATAGVACVLTGKRCWTAQHLWPAVL